MRQIRKRWLSVLLTIAMLFTMLPVSAFVATGEAANHLVISQAYGGGGNSGAEYKNDFVELYNPTDTDVDLTGYAIKYASAKKGQMADLSQDFALSGIIKSQGYYLIQMGAGAGGSKDLPAPDAIGSINMSGKEFAVALFNGETCVDLLGCGSAKLFETAAAPKLSNTTAAVRKDSAVDTDDNSADFMDAAPTPRNSAYSGGETPEPPVPPEEPSIDPAKAIAVADALAKPVDTADIIVTGVVTLVDGQNVYVQDGTGAICLRASGSVSGIALGDTVLGQGKRADYYAVPQLGSATIEKAAQQDMTLTAAEATIADINAGKVPMCSYVKLLGVEITDIYDNNGQWANPNITVKSGTDTIQLCKAVVDKTALAVGDKVDLTAAVSSYTKIDKETHEVISTTTQLRNTMAEEITKAEVPVDPDAPVITPIRDALAGSMDTEFTVKGVVTLVDGQNLYVQDETGAICVRGSHTDIALGDTVIGTGKRAEFKGLPQLASAKIEKSSGMTLAAGKATVGALTDADVCTYVKLTSLEITEIYDNNGQWANPNITLKDASGSTIRLYKAVVDKNTDGTWAFQVGDKVNVKAAVSVFNTTLQLRNTLPSEVTLSKDPEDTAGILGKNVVIYNPVVNKAISKNDDGYNRAGVDITAEGETIKGYTRNEIWTVASDGEGHYVFAALDGGQTLAMDGSHMSLGVDQENDTWTVTAGTTDWVITNVNRGGCTIQWNTFKGATNFSSFSRSKDPDKNLRFYVVETPPEPEVVPGAPENGAQVAIYNKSKDGEAVMGLVDENNASLSAVPATVSGGKATVGNGGRVFNVTVDGSDYIFESGGRYLAANDKENLFLADTLDDYARWNLEPARNNLPGFMMKNKAARYTFPGSTDQKPVYIEYFGGKFTGWTLSGKNGYEIYAMQFLPVANDSKEIMDGIVNKPAVVLGDLPAAYVGQDYKLAFTVDAPFGMKEAKVTLNGKDYTPELVDGQYIVTIPAAELTGEKLAFTISCKDSKDVGFSKTAEVPVLDVPFINDPTPAPNSAVLDTKRPTISVTVANAAEGFTAEMTVNGQAVTPVIEGNLVSYTPDSDMADGPVTVVVKIVRADKAESEYTWKFSMGEPMEQLYFGQLHSHTTYSDGAGSLESALEYVRGIPDRDNVDFVAFTDHSNYFDGSKMGGSTLKEQALYDMSEANGATPQILNNWNTYKQTVADFNASQSKQIALAGFEMTWSGGPGHINTFNTPGIVSRNNKTLNNKTDDAGMKAYYALLSQNEGADSISQFNHPGKTFGTFKDFAYWDPIIDSRICTVEVGNGEGKIHQGGYYPSYGEYTKALDKGWHLAPTNNQDNHKGRWGNANDARDVILTDNFTEEGVYQAIRDRRMYATEDKNLEIFYNVNGQPMGSIIAETPAELNFEIELHDPDSSDAVSKVELIVNSGRVAYTWDKAAAAAGKLTCTLAPEYSYYYVRVTEADGDLAVTAPVWVGDVLKLGISSVECDTAMPVTNEELHIETTLFNSETADATVKKITYTAGGETLHTDTTGYTIPGSSTKTISFPYTFTAPLLYTVKVTVEMEQNGKSYTYSMDITLDVEDADGLVYIGFDAAHYNEYVNGNYKDSMGNFANLASGYAVRTVYLNTSEELIAACSNPKYKMLILTAPSRRAPEAQKDPRSYTPAELDALKAFNAAGGSIVLAGWSDHYEDFPDALPKDFKHMSEAQNEVLAALGSSLRINDDATYDDQYSKIDGVDPWRLYFNTYNMENPLNDGVIYDAEHPYDRLYTEVFSHYGGASIYAVGADGKPTSQLPATVSPVVFAHESTYSKDTDNDGKGAVGGQKYASPKQDDRMLIMATEKLPGKGQIIVSGAAFMSNFEVQAVMDNGQQKNYSNYRICENLVRSMNQMKITPIKDVQAEKQEGAKFTIEGVVTSNASGYDANTAFFDCIYLQDETAGINAFPVAGNFKLGDRVRITGHTSSYNGERQIAVKHIEKIGSADVPAPKAVTAAQINDGSVLGSLVTLKGTVTSFSKDNGLIQTIMVKDSSGQEARVFIDGYITTSKDVQNLEVGCDITVTGLASYDNSFSLDGKTIAPRIRIRDRADVVCTESSGGGSGGGSGGNRPVEPTKPDFVDVAVGSEYYDAIHDLFIRGAVAGIGNQLYGPSFNALRGVVVSILWRLEGRPVVDYAMKFKDIDPNSFYGEAVRWAASSKVVSGYSSERFGPSDPVTMEQLAVMLYNYAKLKGEGFKGMWAFQLDYRDANLVSDWAYEAVCWCTMNKLLPADPKGNLEPQRTVSRGEMAQSISDLMARLEK